MINTYSNSGIDVKVQKLYSQINTVKHNNSIPKTPNPLFNKSISKSFFDYSLINNYRFREAEKSKQEELHKGRLRTKLSNLEALLANIKNIEQVQLLIQELENSLKASHYKTLKDRLIKAKAKFDLVKLLEYEKDQAEILRLQHEKAAHLRIAQQEKEENERIKRVQVLEERKREEEKAKHKAKELSELLIRKSNWELFQAVLKQNNIKTFYHFTDKANLSSIRKYKGLYSWKYMDMEGIIVPLPGSGPAAREEALQFGLSDYVSLSFASDLPMKHVAIKEGRIINPVILKISTEVAFFNKTQFTSMNAADKRTVKGGTIENIKNLHFSLFNLNYFNLQGDDKKYYQAEVLVKTWIPIDYITNLNEYP